MGAPEVEGDLGIDLTVIFLSICSLLCPSYVELNGKLSDESNQCWIINDTARARYVIGVTRLYTSSNGLLPVATMVNLRMLDGRYWWWMRAGRTACDWSSVGEIASTVLPAKAPLANACPRDEENHLGITNFWDLLSCIRKLSQLASTS